ncbi:MAG: cytochrome c, class I [Alphaproteobacteria bacterium]|nr:MAG: cytochrome c, class I [Alphaproteobacteria bacterium]
MRNILSPIMKVGLAFAITSLANAPVNANEVKLGAKVYGGTCVACHGENGKGEIPGVPDLTSAKGPLAKTDAVLLDHIVNGYESPGSDMAMPELGGNEDLTEQDIKNVIAYMRAKYQRKK